MEVAVARKTLHCEYGFQLCVYSRREALSIRGNARATVKWANTQPYFLHTPVNL